MVHRNQVGSIRLIPAHAGKTSGRSEAPLQRATHPRSREENIDAWQLPERHVGSPPLARGKPQQGRESSDCARLIPAHAGKTSAILCGALARAAHPRSRGENVFFVSPARAANGSSPLTRGKPDALPHAGGCERLIPAHAGKTGPQADRPDRLGAHPRSRGENFGVEEDSGLIDGSSPLTRGKRRMTTMSAGPTRLIPAHAGKTPAARRLRTARRAHPRSRGENPMRFGKTDIITGSSPLTRGKPHHRRQSARHRRLIPAHAGKTRRHSYPTCTRTAHPRSRGEN